MPNHIEANCTTAALLLAALLASLCYGQPPAATTLPRDDRPYPWPAPVDSEGAADSRPSRWGLPWPSALTPSWLARSKPTPAPEDPFLRVARTPDPSSYSDGPMTTAAPGNAPVPVPPAAPPARSAPAYGPLAAPAARPDPRLPGIPDVFQPAQIVAWVGNQPILAGDLLGQINEILQNYLEKLPELERSKITDDEMQRQRERLMQQFLPQMVDLNLLYLDFVRTIPKDRMSEIQQRINQRFDEDQLDQLVKKAKLATPKELDTRLRAFGSSLDHQRRLFTLQVLASQARNQNVKVDEEVTPDEMLAYYNEHLPAYEYPAKVRWERLTVQFDRFASRDDARQAIAQMGNEVVHGAPLPAVARRGSHAVSAADGGHEGWTTQGSLASHQIDLELFRLDVGVLSDILEDERGYHIVRVIERRDAGCVSFLEAQVEIKQKILQQRREAKEKEYLARLRQQTYVWTIFDQQDTAQPVAGTSPNATAASYASPSSPQPSRSNDPRPR